MKKIIVSAFALILLAGCVFALELPPEPMAFYGEVTYNGTAIPNGYYLTAKIGTAISGECEIIGGEYGRGSNTCIVLNPSTGTKVEFYLGNYKLGEHVFQSKEIVNLDFTATVLPVDFIPMSDGICDVGKGECSYNVLDCDASKTDVCAGNGVCDTTIGETCTFTPQDCGVCQFCGDAVCNNGETCSTCAGDCGSCPVTPSVESPSGGGGGGGTPTTTPTTTTNGNSSGGCVENWQCSEWSNLENECGVRTCTDSAGCGNTAALKPKTEEACPAIGFLSITGGAIGAIGNFVKSGIGIGVIVVIVLFVAGIIFFLARKKIGKIKNKKQKN